ncbi:MAG TPA: hypothetical protein VGH65_00965 [Verrucomicrobiaceae bacterium]
MLTAKAATTPVVAWPAPPRPAFGAMAVAVTRIAPIPFAAGRPGSARRSPPTAAKPTPFIPSTTAAPAAVMIAIAPRPVLHGFIVPVELRLGFAKIRDPLRHHAKIGEINGRQGLGRIGH